MDVLSTDRLQLVPPVLDYAEDVFRYASDPLFCRYIDALPARSVDDGRAYLQTLCADNDQNRRRYWLIVRDGRCIGSLGFNFLFNLAHRTQDFGYGLAREAWGKGIFNEAAQRVLEYGFTELNLQRVQALTRADNSRSVSALLNLGFIHEATLKQFYQTDAGRADCAVLAIFNT